VSKVQGDGINIEFRYLCLRYRVGNYYCVEICVSEIQSEGNFNVCSIVCLRYCAREILFYTLMCV